MTRQLRHDRPDVLHTHNHLVHHYGVVSGVLARVPVIVNTRHRAEFRFVAGPEGSQYTTESPDKKSDLIFRATLPWVGCVVLISEATRHFFVRYRGIPEGKTRVILNGAHLERFLKAPAHPGSKLPRVRFGIAARLVGEKDHFTLLRAFAIVSAEVPEAELQIAGDGFLRDRLVGLVNELNLAGRVTFVGALPDTAEFLSQLDVFVLSSLNEGLPLALLEAMAAGVPVVATRAGGVEDAAKNELDLGPPPGPRSVPIQVHVGVGHRFQSKVRVERCLCVSRELLTVRGAAGQAENRRCHLLGVLRRHGKSGLCQANDLCHSANIGDNCRESQ